MTGIEALPWGTITPLGALIVVVLIIVRAVVSGKMIPEASQERNLQLQENRLGDRDRQISELSGANRALMEAVRLLTEQSNETLELGRTTHRLIAALADQLPNRGGEDGSAAG